MHAGRFTPGTCTDHTPAHLTSLHRTFLWVHSFPCATCRFCTAHAFRTLQHLTLFTLLGCFGFSAWDIFTCRFLHRSRLSPSPAVQVSGVPATGVACLPGLHHLTSHLLLGLFLGSGPTSWDRFLGQATGFWEVCTCSAPLATTLLELEVGYMGDMGLIGILECRSCTLLPGLRSATGGCLTALHVHCACSCKLHTARFLWEFLSLQVLPALLMPLLEVLHTLPAPAAASEFALGGASGSHAGPCRFGCRVFSQIDFFCWASLEDWICWFFALQLLPPASLGATAASSWEALWDFTHLFLCLTFSQDTLGSLGYWDSASFTFTYTRWLPTVIFSFTHDFSALHTASPTHLHKFWIPTRDTCTYL